MRARRVGGLAAMLAAAGALTTLSAGAGQAPHASTNALVASLTRGGYVLVMRHASSPGEAPDRQAANSDNVGLERQLDEVGRAGSSAMGDALRALKIPVGDVLSSPAYRALETARFARLANPRPHPELGDRGQSMQGATEADGAWLRERARRLPKGTNTIIVTHMPNIARAFPEWGAVDQGEVVVVGSDGAGEARAVGRIRIDEWSRLR